MLWKPDQSITSVINAGKPLNRGGPSERNGHSSWSYRVGLSEPLFLTLNFKSGHYAAEILSVKQFDFR